MFLIAGITLFFKFFNKGIPFFFQLEGFGAIFSVLIGVTDPPFCNIPALPFESVKGFIFHNSIVFELNVTNIWKVLIGSADFNTFIFQWVSRYRQLSDLIGFRS